MGVPGEGLTQAGAGAVEVSVLPAGACRCWAFGGGVGLGGLRVIQGWIGKERLQFYFLSILNRPGLPVVSHP